MYFNGITYRRNFWFIGKEYLFSESYHVVAF